MSTLVAFVPVAALLTITPGAATAMIVRNAARGGRRHALACTLGNEVGVITWALLAAIGVAAIVATSAEVFAVVKLVGAALLIVIGVQSWRGRREAAAETPERPDLHALRDGVVTSMTNPKLAVFYVALFPQFVPAGEPILPYALAMAALLALFDLVYYSALALVVTRAKRAFLDGPWMRRVERLTGAVLIALGVRLALERR